jgi:hypothetical protein
VVVYAILACGHNEEPEKKRKRMKNKKSKRMKFLKNKIFSRNEKKRLHAGIAFWDVQ